MSYGITKSRVVQWLGIILILCLFGGAYWYFQVRASTLNQSQNDLNTNGLVGLWSFNGDDISGTTAYDRSGSGNNGTLTNGPVPVLGKIGQALYFAGDNTGDLVTTASVGTYSTANITASAWVRATASGSGAENLSDTVVQRYNPTTFGWKLGIDSSGKPVWLYYNNESAENCTADVITSPGPSVVGSWHYLVGVRSAAGLILYVDGSQVGTDTQTCAAVSASEPLRIGNWRDDQPTNVLKGDIDEVRVYNRVLSAAEIQSLYVQGKGTEVDSSVSGAGRLDSGLFAYFPLDENTGTSTADQGTNALTGTLTNGPTWVTGQIGSAVDFDGTNDYVTTANTTFVPINYTGHSGFAWVYPQGFTAAPGATAYKSIISYGEADDSQWETGLALYDATGTVVWTQDGFDAPHVSSGLTVPLNQWSFVGFMRTASNVTFFVNGQTATVADASLLTIPAGDPILVGASGHNAAVGGFFNGSIDEARFYNRTLSADEAFQLYRLTAPTGVDTSLKGYWSFNGQDVSGTTAFDRSGAMNTGTLTNGPTKVIGKLGQAINLDGSNDYVTVADNAALKPTAAISYGGWVYVPSAPAGLKTVMEKGTATTAGYGLYVTTDPKFCYVIKTAGGTETDAGPALTTGMWHHVMVTYDSTTPLLYVDGVSQALASGTSCTQTANAGAITQDTGTLTFGSRQGASQFLSGKVDELRVYNRVLSATEIQSLYTEGGGTKANSSASQAQGTGRLDSGLAGYWKLDDGSGTSVTDSSVNGNTGTLTNGPTWGTGQIGGGADLDGTNDYISVTTSTPANLNLTDSFSLSMWFKANTVGTSQTLFSAGLLNNNKGFQIQTSSCTGGNSGNICIERNVAGGNEQIRALGAAYATGTWNHLVVTVQGTAVVMYVNGANWGLTGSWTGNINSYLGTAYEIGRRLDGAQTWNGSIDEVRVYNRVLSADEAIQLYHLGTPTGVDTSLKGYWSFNGQDISGTTAFDRSGAGNTGTLTNGPTKVPGKIGQALSFNGTDQYVVMADASAFTFGTSPVTLVAWVKFNTGSLGAFGGIISQGLDSFELNKSNLDKLRLEMKYADATVKRAEESTASLTEAGRWYHVAATFNPSDGSAVFYVDGVQKTTSYVDVQAGGTLKDSTSSVYIGTRSTGSLWLNGSIDEVRLYSRALSADEITSLYNQGR